MLEDSIDPVPRLEPALRELLAEADRGAETARVADWLRAWSDREGPWTQLRTLRHWIERAGH